MISKTVQGNVAKAVVDNVLTNAEVSSIRKSALRQLDKAPTADAKAALGAEHRDFFTEIAKTPGLTFEQKPRGKNSVTDARDVFANVAVEMTERPRAEQAAEALKSVFANRTGWEKTLPFLAGLTLETSKSNGVVGGAASKFLPQLWLSFNGTELAGAPIEQLGAELTALFNTHPELKAFAGVFEKYVVWVNGGGYSPMKA